MCYASEVWQQHLGGTCCFCTTCTNSARHCGCRNMWQWHCWYSQWWHLLSIKVSEHLLHMLLAVGFKRLQTLTNPVLHWFKTVCMSLIQCIWQCWLHANCNPSTRVIITRWTDVLHCCYYFSLWISLQLYKMWWRWLWYTAWRCVHTLTTNLSRLLCMIAFYVRGVRTNMCMSIVCVTAGVLESAVCMC